MNSFQTRESYKVCAYRKNREQRNQQEAFLQNGAAAKLVSDFKVLIDDAEGLVKATANQAGGRIGDLCQRLGKTFEDRKKMVTTYDKAWLERAESAKTQTESYLREHAWTALLVVAGVGALFGWLFRRR